MLSMNTNLSSLIAQSSMKTSTDKLNLAIERMSTGFKINHAKDNAANYSISTNMTTQINSYMVAEDNAMQALDMIGTADGTLDQIQDKLERLRALQEQASNGTYGEKSLNAINSEANALVDEILRLYNTVEYEGKNILGELSLEDLGVGADTQSLEKIANKVSQAIQTYALNPTPNTESKFIKEITRRDTTNMTKFASVDTNTIIRNGTYSISTPEELAKLATMANNGRIQGGEYVLANDIDLGAYRTGSGWTPIGLNNWSEKRFIGTFDGNGYVISNLYRNGDSQDGLFGVATGTIKNLGLEGCNITGTGMVGGIVGVMMDTENEAAIIENCYVTGTITCNGSGAGGILGASYIEWHGIKISNCHTDVIINSTGNSIGGIYGSDIGTYKQSQITNCFTKGNITGVNLIGGITGALYGGSGSSYIDSCYSMANIDAEGCVGGIIGAAGDVTVSNCSYNGELVGSQYVAGISGYTYSSNLVIKNCTSKGLITADSVASGILGFDETDAKAGTVENCISYSTIDCATSSAGIVGTNSGANMVIKDCYYLGESENLTALIVANSTATTSIENCSYSSFYNDKSLPITAGSAKILKSNSYKPIEITPVNLQIGIYNTESSSINLNTSFNLEGLRTLRNIGQGNDNYLNKIDELISIVSSKQIEYGAASNRLESALEEISIQYENLVSSRSTIRDADITEVSSQYIQQQILQQAAATLMSTANQSPAIALQLI